MGANDSWMYRVAPALVAAATRFAAPIRRMRALARHAPGNNAFDAGGMAVARLITTSWRETAWRRRSASKRLTSTGFAPYRESAARFSGVRTSAEMECPAEASIGTR